MRLYASLVYWLWLLAMRLTGWLCHPFSRKDELPDLDAAPWRVYLWVCGRELEAEWFRDWAYGRWPGRWRA